jgi:cytochrome b561
MTVLDIVSLLLTGLVAAYLVFRFYQDFQSKTPKPRPNIPYMASFTVLLVSGLLLIIFGWEILPRPEIIVVTTLIPLALAVGLVCEFHKEKLGNPYKIFAIIGLLAIILTRFIPDVPRALQIISIATVHSIFGLTIFIIPIMAVKMGKAPSGFIFVTVGEILIGLGGIALTFLGSEKQLLFFSKDFVGMILGPLLLLMALSFTFGFMKKIKG